MTGGTVPTSFEQTIRTKLPRNMIEDVDITVDCQDCGWSETVTGAKQAKRALYWHLSSLTDDEELIADGDLDWWDDGKHENPLQIDVGLHYTDVSDFDVDLVIDTTDDNE